MLVARKKKGGLTPALVPLNYSELEVVAYSQRQVSTHEVVADISGGIKTVKDPRRVLIQEVGHHEAYSRALSQVVTTRQRQIADLFDVATGDIGTTVTVVIFTLAEITIRIHPNACVVRAF